MSENNEKQCIPEPSRFTESDFPDAVKFTFPMAELQLMRQRIHNALPYIHPIYSTCQGLPGDESNSSENEASDASEMMETRDEIPVGWSIFTGSWDRLLNSLVHLRIQNGYTFGAFLYYDGMGGNSLVYGIPKNDMVETSVSVIHGEHPKCNIPIPSPYMIGPVTGDPDDPCGAPRMPENSIGNYMSLFQGDDTPESYLEATILYHELNDFGAYWHSVYWDDVQIIDDRDENFKQSFIPENSLYVHPMLSSDRKRHGMMDPMVFKMPGKIACRWTAQTYRAPARAFHVWSVFEDPKCMELQCDDEILLMSDGGFIY